MSLVFPAMLTTARALTAVMGWRLQVSGLEHLPAAGPAVVAATHVGYWDPVAVGLAVARRRPRPRFLAKAELFEVPGFGWLLRQMDHIPVDRGGDTSTTLERAAHRLHRGDVVVVFPEGTISTSFVPAQGRPGAARMAVTTGAPLVPVAVWGTQVLHTKGRPRTWRRSVPWTVRIGAPVAYQPGEDPLAVHDRLMEQLRTLADAAARAYPLQPVDDHDRWWIPRHLGGTAPTVEEALAVSRAEAEARRARRRAG